MADQTDSQRQAPAAPAPAQAASSSAPDTSGRTKAEWRELARSVFDVSPHALAGALHEYADDDELDEGTVRDLLARFSVQKGV